MTIIESVLHIFSTHNKNSNANLYKILSTLNLSKLNPALANALILDIMHLTRTQKFQKNPNISYTLIWTRMSGYLGVGNTSFSGNILVRTKWMIP